MVSACSACDDSPVIIDHMQANGGVYYQPHSQYKPTVT